MGASDFYAKSKSTDAFAVSDYLKTVNNIIEFAEWQPEHSNAELFNF